MMVVGMFKAVGRARVIPLRPIAIAILAWPLSAPALADRPRPPASSAAIARQCLLSPARDNGLNDLKCMKAFLKAYRVSPAPKGFRPFVSAHEPPCVGQQGDFNEVFELRDTDLLGATDSITFNDEGAFRSWLSATPKGRSLSDPIGSWPKRIDLFAPPRVIVNDHSYRDWDRSQLLVHEHALDWMIVTRDWQNLGRFTGYGPYYGKQIGAAVGRRAISVSEIPGGDLALRSRDKVTLGDQRDYISLLARREMSDEQSARLYKDLRGDGRIQPFVVVATLPQPNYKIYTPTILVVTARPVDTKTLVFGLGYADGSDIWEQASERCVGVAKARAR